MKRSWIILAAVAVAVLGVGLWLVLGWKPSAVHSPAYLEVQFTCDTHGRLVPCGCFSGQMGGLTRLKSWLDESTRNPTNVVRLDVGDTLAGIEDYEVIEYDFLLAAFKLMRFDALNIGRREAALPLETLNRIGKESGMPLISANLVNGKTGEPVFATHRIIERGGFRIGIVGVLDESLARDGLGDGLEIKPAALSLGNLLPELEPRVDAIILLAFADEARLRELAGQFYELDLVLGGKVSQPSQKLEKVNRAAILFTGNESRSMGTVKLRLHPSEKPQAVQGEVILLHDQIPEDEAVLALADSYRALIRKADLAADHPETLGRDTIPGVRNVAHYVGSETCTTCHPGAAGVWTQSAHATAFESLVHKNADADPACIKCHTVGFGTPSGYRRAYGDQKLTNVGCESCHGPGSLHVEQRSAGVSDAFRFRPLGAGDCQQCHYGEFSRPFDWETMWPRIRHTKENATTSPP